MAGPQTVWGIDVGKCALKAIKLRLMPDKTVEAVAADYLEHAKILTQPDADKDALWSAALEKFLSRNDISNDQVVVSVPGQQTLTRFSKLPPVEKKKIPDIVRYEADQQIPFDMDEVVWDYQIFQAPDSPEVEVGIFAMKRELIRDFLLHFTNAGIEPIAVQAAPLALYNGMHFDGVVGSEAIILIDIGTENTDLLVATEHSLWARTIPVGGNNFTEALVKSFKLSFSKAETLKRTAASSKYARQIFQAMRPVFADLVQELQRSIGFYTATHRDTELTRVVALGSAFRLPGLQKYLQQNLQLKVERWEKFEKLTVPATPDGTTEQPASFAVPCGLAVQGLNLSEVNSNLLPPEIAKQVIWRRKRPFFAAAAACLLLAAGTVWMRQISDRKTLEENSRGTVPSIDSVEQAWDTIVNPPSGKLPRVYGKTILAAANHLKSEYNKLSNQGKEERKKIESISKLLENRTVWLKILAAIHEALPEPPAPLDEADSGRAYRDAVAQAGNAPPRDQRTEIFIERFEAVYLANVDDEPITDEWTREIVDEIANEKKKPRPGFVITLRCRTPHKDRGVFVNRSFITRLRETGRQADQGFYINRVGLAGVSSDRTDKGGSTGRGRGSRGRGGRDRDRDRDESETTTVSQYDPVTDESLANDRTYEVKFDVVLQDLPEKKEDKEKPEGRNEERGDD